jgi:hypothetical protein
MACFELAENEDVKFKLIEANEEVGQPGENIERYLENGILYF